MCAKKCSKADNEICVMCGGNESGTAWADKEVKLDSDHQGELQVKLLELLKDRQTELGRLIEIRDPENLESFMSRVRDLCGDVEMLVNVLHRVSHNEATNADLEYIDCL